MTGETCEICAHWQATRERIRFRQRRFTPRGGKWARAQIERAAYESPAENQSALPPSDRD